MQFNAEFREDSTLRTRNVSRSLCLVAVSLVSATINPLVGQEGTSESNSQSSPDRAALAALYNAAGGPRWKNRTDWMTAMPLGDWHGVSTDAAGRVVALELSSNGLVGTIPPEFGQLSNLTSSLAQRE